MGLIKSHTFIAAKNCMDIWIHQYPHAQMVEGTKRSCPGVCLVSDFFIGM